MATSIVKQLQKEIESRRAELQALEGALRALEGGGSVGNGLRAPTAGAKRTRKPRTAAQRAAQSATMTKVWEAKKAAMKKAAKKAPAKKASRKSLAKKVAESSAPKAE
jgi:hypothetical protein